MEFSIVESLSGLQESIFSLFRTSQLNSHEKSKNWSNFIKLPPLPLLAPGQWLLGVPWAAVISGRDAADMLYPRLQSGAYRCEG